MAAGPERVAVTGVGIVSALGTTSGTTFERLCAGEIGIRPVTLFSTEGQRCRLAAEVRGISIRDVAPAAELEAWSRSDALAVIAAREALANAGWPSGSAPLSVAVGGTTGGMLEAEEVLAGARGPLPEDCVRRLLSYPLATSAERVSSVIGGAERSVTVCSACSSGANAIVQGAAWIMGGRSRAVLAGGTDALCRLTFTGFGSLGVMSPEPCRPFDVARSGLSLGEGGAFVMLEPESGARARGARILAFLTGFSVGSEAYHITHPDPSAATATALIREALARAGLRPEDVDYVNAHGTATPQNDASEARAWSNALGAASADVRVSSSKGQLGHTLGAAGAIEAAIAVLTIDRGQVPPTGGLETPDPEIPLHHVRGKSEPLAVRAALSSSFGFGGSGVVLAFERPDAPTRATTRVRRSVVVTGVSTFAPASSAEREDLVARLDPGRSRRFDRASAMTTLGIEAALADAGRGSKGVGAIAGTAYGNLDRSVEFLRRAFERGPRFASPAEFPHLVPSAPAGNASIYLGLHGPVLTVSDLATSAESAVCLAATFVEASLADVLVAGSAEPYDPIVARVLGPIHGDGEGAGARGEGSAFVALELAETARARGREPLAELYEFQEVSEAITLSAPRRSSRALVVIARAEPKELAASEWKAVAKRTIGQHELPAEIAGGFALVEGILALRRGDADEALVLTGSRGKRYAFLLRRP